MQQTALEVLETPGGSAPCSHLLDNVCRSQGLDLTVKLRVNSNILNLESRWKLNTTYMYSHHMFPMVHCLDSLQWSRKLTIDRKKTVPSERDKSSGGAVGQM